jgi:hypothetical protein
LLGLEVDEDGHADEAERLLALRAQQVSLYIRENLHLKMALARSPV